MLLFVFEQVWLPVSIGIFAFVPVRHQALPAVPRNNFFPNELLLFNACLAGCCKLSGKSDLASASEEILSVESKLPNVVSIHILNNFVQHGFCKKLVYVCNVVCCLLLILLFAQTRGDTQEPISLDSSCRNTLMSLFYNEHRLQEDSA